MRLKMRLGINEMGIRCPIFLFFNINPTACRLPGTGTLRILIIARPRSYDVLGSVLRCIGLVLAYWDILTILNPFRAPLLDLRLKLGAEETSMMSLSEAMEAYLRNGRLGTGTSSSINC